MNYAEIDFRVYRQVSPHLYRYRKRYSTKTPLISMLKKMEIIHR